MLLRPPSVALATALALFAAAADCAGAELLAQLDGQAAVIQPDRAPPESVTVSADARGLYHVLAHVNGNPIRVVVDTGASAIYLGRAHARELGIDTSRGRRSEMTTFRGPRTIWVVKLDRVQVGTLVARDVDAWVVEEGAEGPPQPLLGMSFLRRFDLRVGSGAMTLTERGGR